MDRARNLDTAFSRVFYPGLLLLGIVFLYRGIVPRMVQDWWNDPNFSHGLIVPLFSAYLVWEKRRELEFLRPLGLSEGVAGIGFVALGALMAVAGKAGGEYFIMRSSLVVVVGGLFLLLFGWHGLRKCLFPVLFLFFMVPIPYLLYDAVAFPLKMVASWIGEHSLNLAGVPVFREGNIISLPNMQLEVADACSGIRSLMSMMAMSTVVAYFLGLGSGRGLVLFLSAIPVAVLSNSARILLTGLLSSRYGPGVADGFFHQFSGWLIFLVGMVLLLALGIVLRMTRGASLRSKR